jgi:hypothetical protein
MIDQDFRPLTDFELNLIFKLLENPFYGRDLVLEQLRNIEAKQVDEHGPLGCLEFKVNSEVLLPREHGMIAEGTYLDDLSLDDRPTTPRVHILLHVIKWKIDSLEIYKDDDSPILRRPSISEITLAR